MYFVISNICVSFIHYPPPVSFTEDICHQLTHWEKIFVVPTCSFVTYISILKALRNSCVKAPAEPYILFPYVFCRRNLAFEKTFIFPQSNLETVCVRERSRCCARTCLPGLATDPGSQPCCWLHSCTCQD